jgi:hypothetical protein
MLGPVLLLTLVATQEPSQDPVRAEWKDWTGGLRHVQLLEVTDEATTFATSHTRRQGSGAALALYRIPREPTGSDTPGTIGAPFAHAVFEESITPYPTWHLSPPWRVLETTEGWVAVALEAKRDRLTFVRFRDGKRTEIAKNTQDLLDARVDGGVVQVIARTDGHIALYEIEAGQVGLCNLLADDGFGSAATFVAGLPREIAVARWIEGTLHVTHVDLVGAPVLDVALEEIERNDTGESGPRVRAWSDGKRRLDVVGDAGYENRIGRVMTAQFAAADAKPTVRIVPPRLPGTLPRLGHAIDFVRDMDGDELPDVVIGAPGTMTGFVWLLGTRAGAALEIMPTGEGWLAWGSSVSATRAGRFVLVAGGTPTMPEHHLNPAAAALIEITPGVETRSALRQLWSWGEPITTRGR